MRTHDGVPLLGMKRLQLPQPDVQAQRAQQRPCLVWDPFRLARTGSGTDQHTVTWPDRQQTRPPISISVRWSSSR
jgi:hypothetical protein